MKHIAILSVLQWSSTPEIQGLG